MCQNVENRANMTNYSRYFWLVCQPRCLLVRLNWRCRTSGLVWMIVQSTADWFILYSHGIEPLTCYINFFLNCSNNSSKMRFSNVIGHAAEWYVFSFTMAFIHEQLNFASSHLVFLLCNVLLHWAVVFVGPMEESTEKQTLNLRHAFCQSQFILSFRFCNMSLHLSQMYLACFLFSTLLLALKWTGVMLLHQWVMQL